MSKAEGPVPGAGAEPERDPWAAPEDVPPGDVSSGAMGSPGVLGSPGAPGGPGAPVPLAKRDPWAPPEDVPHGAGRASGWSAPSVHDQSTIAAGGPFAAPPPPPPAAGAGEPVPPPPVGPEGPGQVPYGYPGVPGQQDYVGPQGYPGYPGYPGYQGQGPPGYGWPAMPMAPANGMGVTSLVLGIIAAAVFCLWPLAIVLGILAIIFGAIGRGRARRGEATNPGQALAGIICGITGIVLGVGLLVALIVIPDDAFEDGASGDSGRAVTVAANP
ncbi:DUF4190 domain-containing protein [Streptomyces sp. NPDC086554]|uniref:DUF4190 domain-containing protein n=1 Tax=Streptomyces sp. NPDC086554 TaxID=3154864 RepID=UPI00343CFA83